MLRVGLTGGIGAGKSAAAARFAANGAVVIDSDRLAREVVEPGTPGLDSVVSAFGPGVLRDDGGLDRPALGRIVFGDAGARKRLEGILHPLIQARSAALAVAAPPGAIIVNDIPLLVEGGVAAAYHLVLVVDAAPAVRVERLVRDRGMTTEDASARIAAQIDDATRRAAADVVLDNSGPPSALDDVADALWADRLVPFARNLAAGRPASGDPAVVAYDPSWPAQFARLAARIRYRVGDCAIAHVGPTAVVGEAAPDVIGIALTVGSASEADELRAPLAAAGFLPSSDGYASADPGRAAELRVLIS